VAATGSINIGVMQELGRTYDPSPIAVTVVADPTEHNPAHAEVPQKLSRGLSFLIIDRLVKVPVGP
jgi:hypothetical protein